MALVLSFGFGVIVSTAWNFNRGGENSNGQQRDGQQHDLESPESQQRLQPPREVTGSEFSPPLTPSQKTTTATPQLSKPHTLESLSLPPPPAPRSVAVAVAELREAEKQSLATAGPAPEQGLPTKQVLSPPTASDTTALSTPKDSEIKQPLAIILTVNSGYYTMFQNWLLHFQGLKLTHASFPPALIVVADDTEVQNKIDVRTMHRIYRKSNRC